MRILRNYIWRIGLVFAFIFFLHAPQNAFAHAFDYGALNTDLNISGGQIAFHMEVPQQINADEPDQESQRQLFESYFKNNFSIQEGGKACDFKLASFDNSSSSQTVFDGGFRCSGLITKIEDLTIHNSAFADFFVNFDDFVVISIQNKQWNLIFNQEHQDYPANVPAKFSGTTFSRFLAIAARFIWLGVKHILSGYDHILFLISIILLLRSVKRILILVTSFTIAHSITLVLAGLHVVTLSPRIVEPLIALSIAYMAIRNLIILRKGDDNKTLSERWIATFGFGLIHGLGFAGALIQTDIPRAFFVPSLVVFNIGIEVGQLGILAMIVPLLLKTDKLSYKHKILVWVSGIITALAMFWFFQRIL